MKKIRLLLLMLVILMCTGCTIEYNINITEDTIEETINVNDYVTSSRTKNDILKHYNMWYPVFVNYITEGETIEIQDFSQKVDNIEYYEKSINETNDGYKYTYKYTYDLEEYYDSYALATSYIETTVHENSNALVLKTDKENLLCTYDYFDSIKINITIDPKEYKLNYTNTSNINNNTYTWTFNRDNCNNSNIILTLDKLKNSEVIIDRDTKKNILSDYVLYIFLGILLILILIGYCIFKKIKQKNENFNEDD